MITAFNRDELTAQALAGGGPQGAGIRGFMLDQHRLFFVRLPYLFIGTVDDGGWPLPTLLTGDQGFAYAPNATILHINNVPDPGDPAGAGLVIGREIGVLGIDLATRRRNRANGRIAAYDATGLTIAVRQSFGNCPQYIQRRTVHSEPHAPGAIEPLAALDLEAAALIRRADTFFVASRSRPESGEPSGADVSHRGGQPGFVRVEGDRLTIPDFPGNHYFNTLGNLLGEPRAGLLFIDFEQGDILQLQGLGEIDWSDRARHLIEGAERSWHFTITRAWRRRAASPLRWTFLEAAPTTLGTGIWQG